MVWVAAHCGPGWFCLRQNGLVDPIGGRGMDGCTSVIDAYSSLQPKEGLPVQMTIIRRASGAPDQPTVFRGTLRQSWR